MCLNINKTSIQVLSKLIGCSSTLTHTSTEYSLEAALGLPITPKTLRITNIHQIKALTSSVTKKK